MNVIELVCNNIKDEIYSTAKRYINLINEYSECSDTILPADVLNGSVYKRLKKRESKTINYYASYRWSTCG
jgi:hypothetical protein